MLFGSIISHTVHIKYLAIKQKKKIQKIPIRKLDTGRKRHSFKRCVYFWTDKLKQSSADLFCSIRNFQVAIKGTRKKIILVHVCAPYFRNTFFTHPNMSLFAILFRHPQRITQPAKIFIMSKTCRYMGENKLWIYSEMIRTSAK